jgi:tRNA nucleotidyltransferase (CCA-adding enzyme)
LEKGAAAVNRDPATVPAESDRRRSATERHPAESLLAHLETPEGCRAYPELAAIRGVPQDPEWHPEGTVDVHTRLVMEAAAEIAERERLSDDARAVLLFAALTHDLGKASTTCKRTRNGRARWTSYGHEQASVPIAERLLARLGVPRAVIAQVLPLVEHHMAYRNFADPNAGTRTVRRLARSEAPATIRQLAHLIEADHSGRPPLPRQLPPAARRMVELAESAGVLDGP